MNEVDLGRRRFTLASALALLAGVSVTITACGGSSSPGPTGPSDGGNSGNGGVAGTISSNHGHVARITGAELTAGGALSLDISGTAGHPHTVELSG